MAEYNVCIWDDAGQRILETIYEGGDFTVGRTVYAAAKVERLGVRLTFRHGARVIRDRMPDGTERS